MSKIYLVDDQPISNFITKKLLEIEGYQGTVKDFTNPREAMEFVSEDSDAIIFLDLNMPEMNGWEFLEMLQSRNCRHRIIILTSSTSKIDVDKAKDYPAVIKYMVKPMNKQKFSELSRLLKAS
ncbi:response regulator [uncultured Christiangramia sp.]|uniref:response regulator n=1 Tax=uncultured Christiangramia sp. TaxID=503836 RepID=UPI0025E8EA49|nr:response regulator [uncultured Christiangramia sp.]